MSVDLQETADQQEAMTLREVAAEVAALRRTVCELRDRAEINELIDRYVILLDTQDDHGFDSTWPATVFTDDVRLHFPIGIHEGLEGVAEFHHAGKVRFDRTLHLSANHAITLDGDRARVRMHLLATHVHHPSPDAPDRIGTLFDIGGHYGGEAVRTERGWRFSEWGFHLTWAAGPGPDGKPVM
ncbi:nuclear transport factor 2 family protein (plasmid) [Streptomyces sp. NBC_01384]|uniref:nuclear transport factor 2 family protein n=1 Tax=Streptomyces sp. NBC_01384 TaxID=2903847 RepID=UPI002F91AF0D